MAWTTPRTWVDTEVPTAALMNTHLRDNFDFIAVQPKELWVSRSSTQSITNNSPTLVSWNSEERDVGFSFSPTSTTATTPEAGLYCVTSTVQWAGNGTGPPSCDVEILIGGSTVIANGGPMPVNNEGNAKTTSATLRIAGSTSVQTRVRHNHTAALDIQPYASGPPGTSMKVVQVQRTVT